MAGDGVDITAARMAAAYDAVADVVGVILRRADDLEYLPAGRDLVRRARRVAAMYDPPQDVADSDASVG